MTTPNSTTWRSPIPTLPVQCSHILCSCIHHPDKLQLQRVSTWSQIASWMDIPSANPPRLSSTGNKPLTPPGYLPFQSVVLCLGTGAVQRELSVTAMAQTGSIVLGNNVLLFLLPFCAMCHGWLPPNQITAGTAQTGFLSKTAANGGFLLPFWESLCSLLTLLPTPNDNKRHKPEKAPSLPKPSAQDMAGMELICIPTACMVLGFRSVAWKHTRVLAPAAHEDHPCFSLYPPGRGDVRGCR